MSATRSFRALSVVSMIAFVAGCPTPENKPPEEEAPGVVFAEADDEQLAEAFSVAVGLPLIYAQFAQFAADMDASVGECPTYSVIGEEPLQVRYDAGDGCTTSGGSTYAGSAEVTNPLAFGAEPNGDAIGGTFDAFLADDGSTPIGVDGEWAQTASGVGEDYQTTADITVSVLDRLWSVTGAWDITWDGDVATATCAEGMLGEVDGLGAFTVRCETVGFGTSESSGWVEIEGADVVRVDLTLDADGCFPVTIDGAAHAPLCSQE